MAFVNVAMFAFSSSNVTVAVLASNETSVLLTPGTADDVRAACAGHILDSEGHGLLAGAGSAGCQKNASQDSHAQQSSHVVFLLVLCCYPSSRGAT